MPMRSCPVRQSKGMAKTRPTPLNVLIPMGGLSSNEYTEAGYRVPKPMVPIVGRPMLFWLVDNLELEEGDHIWVGLQRSIEATFAVEHELRREYPELNVHFVRFDFETRGVTETLFCILNAMDETSRTRRTISLDSDVLWFCDVLGGARALPPAVGASFFFKDSSDDVSAPYSYIRVQELTSEIIDIREKVAISNHANAGAYVFASGDAARDGLEALLDEACAASSSLHLSSSGGDRSPRGRMMMMMATGTSSVPSESEEEEGPRRRRGTGSLTASSAEKKWRDEDAASQVGSDMALGGEALVPVMERGKYVSGLIARMMAPPTSTKFLAVQASDFANLGTPARLRAFVDRLRRGEVAGARAMRFCFGLDGTLLSMPGPQDYAAAQPIGKNIAILRELHDAGHTIIIWTDRGSAGSAASIKAAAAAAAAGTTTPTPLAPPFFADNGAAMMAKLGRLTFDQLDAFNVPYDEIVFGQPHADVYVDARACNSVVDLDQALGWDAMLTPEEAASKSNMDLAGGVKPRHFNAVRRVGDDHVEKTGPRAVLRGEAFWYQHIPASLADIFPHAVSIKDHPALDLSSILLTRVVGVTYSHLVVNACVTGGRLNLLLDSLKRLHFCPLPLSPMGADTTTNATTAMAPSSPSSGAAAAAAAAPPPPPPPPPLPPESAVSDDLLCSNYRAKVAARYAKHRVFFESFDDDTGATTTTTAEVATVILALLGDYETSKRFQRAAYIHGDPVFSNVLLTSDSRVKFLDMRGALGDQLTTAGDVAYDLSKVYQSLCGYDFIILDVDRDGGADDALRRLRDQFASWLAKTYAGVSLRDVRVLTAAHFFCIVPLHDNRKHQTAFLQAAQDLLRADGHLS